MPLARETQTTSSHQTVPSSQPTEQQSGITDQQETQDALQETAERLQLALSASGAGDWVWDAATDMVTCSERAAEIFGIPPGPYMTWTAMQELLHEQDRENARVAVEQSVAGHQDYGTGYRIHRASDGTEAWVSARGRAIYTPEGMPTGMIGVVHDITEQKHQEEALQQEARANETLNRVGAMLAAELNLDRLMQVLTDEATALCGAQFGSFFYNAVNAQGESYVLYTLSGVPREAFAQFPLPRNTAVFAPTFAGEGPVRSEDITHDPRYGKSSPYYGMPPGHLPVRSYLALPVRSRSGEVLGGLFFGHAEPGVFTEWHERILVGFASQASIAIDNARLYQTAQREITEREQTQRALEERERALSFLVHLNDALRELSNPIEVMTVACRMLGEHLRVSRCAYAPMEEDNDHFTVEGDYNNGVQSIVGRYPLSAFGPQAVADLSAGRPYVINDIDMQAQVGQNLAAYRQTQIQAVICVSLVKDGKMAALMAVHQERPRQWTQEEVKLVEMVAERLWAHVQQVDAAKQLSVRAQEVEALNLRLTRAMRETHHRVKNNLQVVAAMIDMQAMEHCNEQVVPLEELTRLGTHVRTLAIIHDLLTKNLREEEDDQCLPAKEVLEKLVPLLRQSAGTHSLQMHLDEVELTGKQCMALAIITNELVSNAFKHGGTDVAVSFFQRDSNGKLQVRDNGKGFPEEFDPLVSANTGLQLVEAITHTDLSGTVDYTNTTEGGAQVMVAFPLLSQEP